MRHQTAVAGGASAGASRQTRLDPSNLPLRFLATIGPHGRRVAAEVLLDRKTAVIKRPAPLGPPLIVRLPISAYDGVAVRMRAIGDGGRLEVVVELMHRDSGLNLPLCVANDPLAVAADWQAWGEAFGLPLLLIDQDGRVVTADNRPPAATIPAPRQRRPHSFFADRRPRFLTRRKQGWSGHLDRLSAREIIARD